MAEARNVRIGDVIWERAKLQAVAERVTLREVTERALYAYLDARDRARRPQDVLTRVEPVTSGQGRAGTPARAEAGTEKHWTPDEDEDA